MANPIHALRLGHIAATPGALKLLCEECADAVELLARHASGDWGELSEEDQHENEISIKHGYRVLSNYPIGDRKLWIITEADRSATTLLLPEEY